CGPRGSAPRRTADRTRSPASAYRRVPAMADDLWMLSARETVSLLRAREVAPRECIESALRRIEQVDGAVNALPTLCPERALEHAGRVSPDTQLAGLPIAIKDLVEVAGVRSTFASPIYADNVPERSDLMVERLERRGGVVLAKSNT